MPNLAQHQKEGFLIGAVSGAVIDFFRQTVAIKNGTQQSFDFGKLFANTGLGAVIGAATVCLPDVIEPATSPHHRKSFHSVFAATGIVLGMVKAENSNLEPIEKNLIHFGGIGYLTHLVSDSKTPFGLPII